MTDCIINLKPLYLLKMNFTEDINVIDRYGIVGVFTTVMTMATAELYSGNENDPEIIGHLQAHDLVPRDFTGQMLPYDVVVSMPIFPLKEGVGEAIDEMSHRMRMNRQRVKTSVVIFRDIDGYEKYMEDGYRHCV